MSTREVLTVFIASPGDVADERRALAVVASRINRISGREWGWEVDLRGWEDTMPGYARPQSLINPDVDACDIFIGILWERWGQPTGTYSSGFEEEFERAMHRHRTTNRPEIMLYFKDVRPESLKDPGPQLNRVLEFRNRIQTDRALLYRAFGTVAEFDGLLFEHLMKVLAQRALGSAKTVDESPSLLRFSQEPIAPTSLLDLCGDPEMTVARLVDRWEQASLLDQIPVLPCAIGPQGLYRFDALSSEHLATLVVGSTGSGKSEALASIATAAVLSIPPDLLQVSFVDLKVWSLVRALESLGVDHVDLLDDERGLGLITNRISRRERLLVDAKCDDAADFWSRYPERRAELPKWLIFVDEIRGILFGRDDGLSQLLGLVARCRPLGMHFILGAQRIDGIGDNIRALSSRRIALRAGSTADSLDVVGVPESSLLPPGAPGTALIRENTAPARLVRFALAEADDMERLAPLLRSANNEYLARRRSEELAS